MDITKPRVGADIEQTLSFDETTGVLVVGWTARPAVNLGSSLGVRLSVAEAQKLAAALTDFAGRSQP